MRFALSILPHRSPPLAPWRRAIPLVLVVLAAACSDGTTAPHIEQPPDPTTPSAFDLVDSALARGEIDAARAQLQKVFAALGDPRLEPRFNDPALAQRTNLPDPIPLLLRTAAGRFGKISPAARQALAPYFQPPLYVGSAWLPRAGASLRVNASGARASVARVDPEPGPEPIRVEGWTFVDAPGIPVRVWSHPEYSKGPIAAARVISVLQDKVWPTLTTLMGRPPLSDEGPHVFEAPGGETMTWGDGGSGRFDIYMMEPSRLGLRSGGAVTIAYPPGCGERPGFMLLSASLNETYWPLDPSLAHEFFHALQFAFARQVPCDEAWDEASAQWASHYVYPRWDPQPSTWQLTQPDSPLDGVIGYWKWLFPAYLQHAHSPDLIRATYERYASSPTAMHAVNKALPGGLKRHHAEFAMHAWNHAPGEASFVAWEGMSDRPEARYLEARTIDVKLDGAPRVEGKFSAPPNELSRKYNPMNVTDQNVRWLEITNVYAGRSQPRISLQAWVKIRGQAWKLEDWTERRTITFCRTRAAEQVDSLVLVQADYTLLDGGPHPARPDNEWEARTNCPEAYGITVREWTTSETYGTTYDISYTARVATPPSGDESELTGTGTYRGTIITHKANCQNGEPDRSETFAMEGKLESTGYSQGPDGWFGYVLATLDWDFMPFSGSRAQTDEEKDSVRGLGSVGSALRPLQLSGGAAERTDTLTTSWSDCTGTAYRIRTTTVRR